jgi:outer membrane protein
MSGKSGSLQTYSAILLRVLLVGQLAAIQPVWAIGVPDLLEDPLWTQPDRLKNGATLPDDSPLPCPAQIDFKRPLALGDAVDVALCNNPQVRGAWAQIKVEAGGLGQARAAYLPTINGSYSRLKNSTTYPATSNIPNSFTIGNQAYGSFNWRLFDFGGRAANRESANQLLAAAMSGHDAALQKVMVSVIQAYFDAMSGKALYEARRQMADLAENTLNATKRREMKGAAALSDSLQASTALAKARLNESRSGGDYQKSLGVLKQAMGIPASTQIHLPIQIEGYQQTDIKDLNSWLTEAEEKHPAIKQAKAKWASDKAKITATRSEGLPTLDGTAYISRNGYPNQGLSYVNQTVISGGITINFPIFEGFGRTYKVRGAEAQAELSEAQLQDTTNQILTDVIRAHADATTSLGVLNASERLLMSAKEAVQSSQRRYDKNAADILELLNTQAALADAQQERIRAVAEYRSARLRLLANTGILGKMASSEGKSTY